MLLEALLRVLEALDALEVRAGKAGRGARLERAAEKKLRWEEGGKLHIESGTRGGQIDAIAVMVSLLLDGLRVNRRDVCAARVSSISKPIDVGSESAVRETGVAVGGLGRVTEAIRGTGASLGTRHVLHPKKMRWDKTVPSDVG